MSLQSELKAIDLEALKTTFNNVSVSSWGRLNAGELPVEFFDITQRYPIVQALADTCLVGFLSMGNPERAHGVSSGAFMAMITMGSHAATTGSPRLDIVDPTRLEPAFMEFRARLADGYEPVMGQLAANAPFAVTLFDAAYEEAVESGLPKDQKRYFVDGALHAAGTLAVYAEQE